MLLYVFLILTILLVVSISLLGLRIILKKGGEFPNSHIGRDENMRKKGIGCATSQDREAQYDRKNKIDIKNLD